MTHENKLASESNRVLGRVLTVEEVNAVSGARPLTTFPPKDTGYVYDVIPLDAQDVTMSSLHTKTL